jgi:hypothetical protein
MAVGFAYICKRTLPGHGVLVCMRDLGGLGVPVCVHACDDRLQVVDVGMGCLRVVAVSVSPLCDLPAWCRQAAISAV